MNEELKEWLGLTPQDFLVYASLLACAVMYFTNRPAIDIGAALFAVSASLIACLWGMKADVRLSAFSNWVKKVSYPVSLAFVVICIYLNFKVWNAC